MSQFPSSTSPTVTTLLQLILTTILTVTSSEEIYEGSYAPLPLGYSYGYLQTPPKEQFFSTRYLLKCAAVSLTSQSEFFSYNNVSRVCKNYSPKNIMTMVRSSDSNEMSFFRSSGWIKTYAISMGANSLIYNSFLNKGNPSTWNVEKCNGIYCPNFFRHPILDMWNHLPITMVKLVLYKNQTAVVTMLFDGRNTTLENWFSVNNLKSSPWDDLKPGNTNFFSLAGAVQIRRFYVSHRHAGCSRDFGWLTINEKFLVCDWERSNHFPTILYSETHSKTNWTVEYGVADSMAIFILLEQN